MYIKDFKLIDAHFQVGLHNCMRGRGNLVCVLGVMFDSKLNWNDHIAKAISKSNSALHCIRLIKHYINNEELAQLITSNFYSILYYNAEIWNIPTLSTTLQQRLLSVLASALKICTPSYHDRMSFLELHRINNRATPKQMCQ